MHQLKTGQAMHLTAFADYSMRVLMMLAVNADQRVTIREIAAAYDVSRHHMMKVVSMLTRAELVDAVRGQNGGLRLARPAASIGVGEVIRLTEDGFALVECFRADNRCVLTGTCRLTGVLDEALGAFLSTLDNYTLADLVKGADEVRALLQLPTATGNER